MYKIKKGDIVGRISYGKDILFTVENIVKRTDGKKIAILKGLIIRIEADADIEDLVLIEKKQVKTNMRSLDSKIENKVKKYSNKQIFKENFLKNRFFRSHMEEKNGKILHLDGDKKYTDKSIQYYKKLGLDAVVRNVPENRQEYVVVDLLNRYNPDVLVITRTRRYD